MFDSLIEQAAIEGYLLNLLGGFSVHAGYGRNLADDPQTGFFAVTDAPVTKHFDF